MLFDKNGENYDVHYYLKDPLRTVEALVGENGAVVEAYAYEVYGKPTIKTGDGGAESLRVERHHAGKWYYVPGFPLAAGRGGRPWESSNCCSLPTY